MIRCVYKSAVILILSLLVHTVSAACPTNCNSCDASARCTSCKTGSWGLNAQCQSSCIETCFNKECNADTGYCLACKPGLYGLNCQHNCSLCEDGLCDLLACRRGCKSGYYEHKVDTENACLSCSDNCRFCSSNTACSVCNDGFHLFKYNTSRKIVVQCDICHFGANCLSYCAIQNCNQCEVVGGSLLCKQCDDGYRFNGDLCIRIDNNCAQGCSTDCDVDGKCLGSCNAGWTGEQCSGPCASQCLRCDKNNAYTCQECKGEYYTENCNIECNPSCIKLSGNHTCRINDGYCNNGCENKYFGQFCNHTCYKGCVDDWVSQVCDRDNGTCRNGCSDGYNGDQCDTVPSEKPTSRSEVTTKDPTDGKTSASVQKKDTNVIIIGAGAGGGILVLICLIVLIVCMARRRRKPDNHQGMNGETRKVIDQSRNATLTSDEKDKLYAKPMKPTQDFDKEGKQDYIYAQPNKPKKAKKPSKKEISEPHKLYDNIAVDFEDEQETVEETNVDAIGLENLDEGTISSIETEENIPTADTYYNTASLIRSRIQISNLLEYTKMKMDYENEFEKLPKGLTRTYNEARKPKNLAKNRYNGIYAYDATRVVLQSQNYVNANYIDGQNKSPEYIASLGPTRSVMKEFEAFWEMIWQEKTAKIVMLTHLEESGKMKCEQYWPNQATDKRYGGYKVTCIAEESFSDFVVREFNIKRGSETRKVTQFHYTAWPDKTVPDTVASLVEFRDKVEQTQIPSAGPIMVHCSAGIGRTGTYIALDILIREGKGEGYVDIFGCVAAIRGQRAHMVQNLEQYIFLHHCVLYALTCDPQPLSDNTILQVMTDKKISSQYQAFMELQMPPCKDRRSVAINKSRKENRKGADIPGDNHRVWLTLTKNNYINAVYLNGYLKADKFIIAQSPLPNTLEDFVSMLYQEECPCVVCLDEEHIHEKAVGQYIPPANKVLVFGDFQVVCKSSNSTKDFVVRELNISRTGSPSRQEVSIWHYQFKGLSRSERVPTNVQAFLKLVVDSEKARKCLNSDRPIVVHCLTGSERSSLFCVVSILLEKSAVEKELSVINTVCQVRSRRRSAFQNIEHFRFCYTCVKEMSKFADTNDYCNTVKELIHNKHQDEQGDSESRSATKQ